MHLMDGKEMKKTVEKVSKRKNPNVPYPELAARANKAITEPRGACLLFRGCTCCTLLLATLLLLLPHLVIHK